MAEEVQTGGVMSFRYDSSSIGKLSDERKREIEEAYKEADERKKKEKSGKIFIWILIFIVVLIILAYFFLKN